MYEHTFAFYEHQSILLVFVLMIFLFLYYFLIDSLVFYSLNRPATRYYVTSLFTFSDIQWNINILLIGHTKILPQRQDASIKVWRFIPCVGRTTRRILRRLHGAWAWPWIIKKNLFSHTILFFDLIVIFCIFYLVLCFGNLEFHTDRQ